VFLILFVVFVMFLLRDNALFLLFNRIVDWIEEEEEDIVEVIIVYSYSSFVSSLFSAFNNEVYICYIYIYIYFLLDSLSLFCCCLFITLVLRV